MESNDSAASEMFAVAATFWLDRDPGDMELMDIAREATVGGGLIAHRRDTYVAYPALDAHYSPEAGEFFRLDEGVCPTRAQACAQYARELLDIHAQIASLRERYVARVGYRAILADLTTLTHLESMLEDTGNLHHLPAVLENLVASGSEPCVSGGDADLWEWERDETHQWLTCNHPEYADHNSEDEEDDDHE